MILLLLPRCALFDGVPSPTNAAIAAYVFTWTLFTFAIFFGTLKANRALQSVFLSLAILFFLLTARDLTGITDIGIVAGYEGILCGLSAVYTALAEVLNEAYGRTVLPISPTKNAHAHGAKTARAVPVTDPR